MNSWQKQLLKFSLGTIHLRLKKITSQSEAVGDDLIYLPRLEHWLYVFRGLVSTCSCRVECAAAHCPIRLLSHTHRPNGASNHNQTASIRCISAIFVYSWQVVSIHPQKMSHTWDHRPKYSRASGGIVVTVGADRKYQKHRFFRLVSVRIDQSRFFLKSTSNINGM